MSILLMMVPIALLLGGFFVCLFLWGVKSGQNDDLETPKHRMLFEEETKNE